jgi:L-ascorbate metabolism protein UlaG (beta-lactamase superfamily)
MIRVTSTLAAVLAMVAVSQNPSSVRLRFIGNESVAISDGTLTLVTDFPYQSGYSGYNTYEWPSHGLTGDVVSVITHEHRDHWEPKLFATTPWRVVGPSTLAVDGHRLSVPRQPVRIADATITGIRTPHAGLEHYSYLIEWKGRRLYFVGDTESADALLAQKRLDIAFVTSWLWNRVKQAGRTIDANRIVLYHHQRPDETLRDCDRCIVPKQGAGIEFAVNAGN